MTIPQSLDEQAVESGPPVSLRERTLRPDESAARMYAAPDEPPAINLRANSAAEGGEPAFDVTTVMERAMIDGTHAGWKDRTLRPDESLTRGAEPTSGVPAAPAPTLSLRAERTPAEFSHLYASLERQISGVGEVTLMSGETLGAERPYVLGVTSAVLGEGKTTVALHLAMTIARDTFKRVCLIDMSLGKGDLGARLGVPSRGEGVVAVLEDANNVVPTLQLAGCDNLVVIPAGKSPTNAARLARSPRVAQLIISARMAFDVVIVDLPAVASDNALPLARHVDGLLVVARAGATPADVVASALDALGRDKVVGVTLNRVKSSAPRWLQKQMARA